MGTQTLQRIVLSGGLLLGMASSSIAAPARGASFVEPAQAVAVVEPSYETPTYGPVDPKLVIRAKAMERAKQRAHRMAALNWYGHSPARPRAISTPLVGVGAFGRAPAYAPRTPVYIFR